MGSIANIFQARKGIPTTITTHKSQKQRAAHLPYRTLKHHRYYKRGCVLETPCPTGEATPDLYLETPPNSFPAKPTSRAKRTCTPEIFLLMPFQGGREAARTQSGLKTKRLTREVETRLRIVSQRRNKDLLGFFWMVIWVVEAVMGVVSIERWGRL